MRALTKSEAIEWCAAHNIIVDERKKPQPSVFKGHSRDFKVPSDAGQRMALLHELFRSIPKEQEILLWFTDWAFGPHPSGLICLSVSVIRMASIAH